MNRKLRTKQIPHNDKSNLLHMKINFHQGSGVE
jgi:hypothetical protein